MKFSLQTLVAAVTVSSASAMWGYWVPPLDEPGVSCEHKRIKIPDHGEYTCMTVGAGICRDNGGYFGEWRFGVEELSTDAVQEFPAADFRGCTEGNYPVVIDPATKRYPLIGPAFLSTTDGERCIENDEGWADRACTYAGTTHICIGENIDTNYAKFSDERPYLFFYNEKTHTFLYQLVCDGAGTEGKLPQMKMVNNEDLADEMYVDYPVDIVKFKKGTTANPADNNELWNVLMDWNGFINGGQQGLLEPSIQVANPYFCQEYYGGDSLNSLNNNGGVGTTLSCWDNDCTAAATDQAFRTEHNIFTNEQMKAEITPAGSPSDGCETDFSPEN